MGTRTWDASCSGPLGPLWQQLFPRCPPWCPPGDTVPPMLHFTSLMLPFSRAWKALGSHTSLSNVLSAQYLHFPSPPLRSQPHAFRAATQPHGPARWDWSRGQRPLHVKRWNSLRWTNSSYYLLSTVLSTLLILTHLILTPSRMKSPHLQMRKQEECKYLLGQAYSARKQQPGLKPGWSSIRTFLTPPRFPSKVLKEQKDRQNSVMSSHMLVT